MTPETVSHLIQILEKTVSPDTRELAAAKNFLEQAAVTNLPEFLKSLSDVLQHAGNSLVARMAAGLQIKNLLTCKDPDLKLQCQQRWMSYPDDIRNYIKKNCLSALGTETHRPSSAAQCVAAIAVIELCEGQWQELISVLTANVTNPSSTEIMKESTLEAIGYICQDIDSEILTSRANEILTAIVHGMKRDERSDNVRLAATLALLNSLEFTRANFDNESERNVIMQVVCEATQSTNTQIKVAALQCLVKIMSTYYQYMELYMSNALFSITLQAMQSDIDEVALQGIEFWSSVCDEEIDLNIEASEAREQGRPPARTSRHYTLGAYQVLTPVLMLILTHQEEFDDDDEWNPAKASGVCLMLLANCCGNSIVSQVIPFVKSNINNPDWKFREAAVLAFGSILEGPDTCMLQPLVEQAMPMLTELMYDSSVMVKDTTAWAIGKVCDVVPDAVRHTICPLLEALVNGLNAEPRVAANVCWAFSSLAEAAYEAAQPEDGSDCPSTYMLSNYFEGIVHKLFETAERADGAQKNLRGAAYEAIMELIKNSPADCYETVRKATMVVLDRLMKVLQMELHIQSSSDRAQYNDLQSLLCATLQSVLKKVTPEDAPQISDAIMTALLQMFSSAGKSGGVQEDALMAVTSLVGVINEGFIKYMNAFKPFLIHALKNHTEHQVCVIAVGLVGDVSRGLGSLLLPYCDEIMQILLENLASPNLHRSVKPHIFSAFGDIALAIGPAFKKYLQIVLSSLYEASTVQVDTSDYDLLEYLNDLRESCLDAFTGIIQGLKGDGDNPSEEANLMNDYLAFLTDYIISIASDQEISEGCISACAGLIGDLISVYKKKVAKLTDCKAIDDMLTAGRRSKESKVKAMCSWATREIRKFKNQSS